MSTVTISRQGESWIRIDGETSIMMELNERFTFFAPNYKYSPLYKERMWDGKIRLFSLKTRLIYSGLLDEVIEFLHESGYGYELAFDNVPTEFTNDEAKRFIESLKLPFTEYEHQFDAFTSAVRKRRALFVSPTASGKSLMIYMLARYYDKKTLIVVPTVQLVEQIAENFADYGYEDEVHKIYAGADKNPLRKITISTWQSVYEQSSEWYSQFDVVIGDEAHNFKAKSLIKIMTSLNNCRYRFGFTGSLDGIETNHLVLVGLFGPIVNVVTTAELMEKGHIAKLDIKAVKLIYPDAVKKVCSKLDYQEEMDFLVSCEPRNRFIKNLALSLKGNTLVLFQYVDKHGIPLEKDIRAAGVGRTIALIHGKVELEDRERARKMVETEDNSIIIASYGTFSTGIDMPNLHNVIFASPSKSRIRVLQSIGRGLRTAEGKDTANLYDIGDDLSWRKRVNKTLKHFVERLRLYASEGFRYRVYEVELSC